MLYQVFYEGWYYPVTADWCLESESNYRYCKNVEGNVDVAVYQGDALVKSCGTLELGYGLAAGEQIYGFACLVRGDAVLLSKKSNSISVSEIVVVGGGETLGNYMRIQNLRS